MQEFGDVTIQRAIDAREQILTGWLRKNLWPSDVIGDGDEASVLVCLEKNARKLLTVDLAKSFSKGIIGHCEEGTDLGLSFHTILLNVSRCTAQPMATAHEEEETKEETKEEEVPGRTKWVFLDARQYEIMDGDVDVVFSHRVLDGVIGEGDEASVLVYFEKNEKVRGRKLVTVDLAKSFSRGSLVAVTDGTSLECQPFLFMDDLGNEIVVIQQVYESKSSQTGCAFAVSLTTGRKTKLCNACTSVSKVNTQLVKLDTTTFNVFTRVWN
ncbi:hypothetical protein Pelo_19055 [Pelomyxa schiedti]|nr:hypothetical protein Pelo_19055 [Pelomyxa schiedti]